MSDTETASNSTEETESVNDEKTNIEQNETHADIEDDEEQIYSEVLPNQVIVARNHPLSYFVDRSRRILRVEDTLFVAGRGNTISMACTLVEVLKRLKIAAVDTIATGMNVQSFFTKNIYPTWTEPIAMIEFKLKPGEFGKYISDYQQRKVIDIFELSDKEMNGYLTFQQIEDLKLSERFRANEQQIEESKIFLSQQKEKQLDLPLFIKYASILIHPLLKDKIFKSVLVKEFNIAASDRSINIVFEHCNEQ